MSSSYCPLRTFVSLAVWNVNKKGDWGQRAASGFMTHSLINERKGVKASSLERVCRLTTLNQHARKIYLPQTWDKLQPRILSKQISWMQYSTVTGAENLLSKRWDPVLFVCQHPSLINLPTVQSNPGDAIGHFIYNSLQDQIWVWIFFYADSY